MGDKQMMDQDYGDLSEEQIGKECYGYKHGSGNFGFLLPFVLPMYVKALRSCLSVYSMWFKLLDKCRPRL